MSRLVRIAVLALAAGTLAGCGMMGDSSGSADGARAADTTPMAPDVESNLRQAQLLRTKGDMVGAVRIMSQLMLVYPDDARVVGEYGKLLVQQKASADAVQFLNRAIELQPNDWTFYSALGVAFDQQSDRLSAKSAYERALTLKPGEPAVLNNYAMSRMLAGDPQTARTLLLAAKQNGSTDPRIDANLALLAPPAPAPAQAVASAAPPRPVVRAQGPVVTAPSPKPVTSAPMPPVVVVGNSATGAPKPLVRGQVVMQAVPVDPLAGPVAKKAPKPIAVARKSKPGKTLASAPHAAPRTAAATPETKAKAAKVENKPEKKAKPADRIPALRMTADAGRP